MQTLPCSLLLPLRDYHSDAEQRGTAFLGNAGYLVNVKGTSWSQHEASRIGLERKGVPGRAPSQNIEIQGNTGQRP